jgi:hypothetical protein
MKTGKRKELFLENLSKGFNITDACLTAGINRRTYYLWVSKDPSFVKACEDIQESLLDHVESKVLSAINKDNLDMIKWYLDHKGKSRGYGQTEQAITGSIEVSIVKKVIGSTDVNPLV